MTENSNSEFNTERIKIAIQVRLNSNLTYEDLSEAVGEPYSDAEIEVIEAELKKLRSLKQNIEDFIDSEYSDGLFNGLFL